MTTLADLGAQRLWIAWQQECRAAGEKPTKIPYSVNGTGGRADVTNPNTRGSRADAEKKAAILPKPFGMGGVGIVLTALNDEFALAGIDLDSCRQGTLTPWAQAIVDRFASYTEVSPSKTGLKVFFRLRLPDREAVRMHLLSIAGASGDGRKWAAGTGEHPPAIELFVGRRYFTVTGQRLPETPEELRIIDLEDVFWIIDTVGPELVAAWRRTNGGGDAGDAGSRDHSRSAAAFRLACRMHREGKSFEDFVSECRADPETASWAREKGEAYGQREFKRAWDKAGAAVAAAPDWDRNDDDRIIANSLKNVRLALEQIGVKARHDVFANRSLITVDGGPETVLDDATLERLWLTVDERFSFRPGLPFFTIVLRGTARRHEFHPVKDYLDSLTWDGTKRLGSWLFDYGSVPRQDEAYNRYVSEVGRIILTAAVRRVRRPGCKFDEILVLISETQGTAKSTALSILAIRPEWFTDSIDLGARDKEAIEQQQGKWIIEIPELRGRRRNDVDRIKAFLSRTADRARLAYARLPVEAPRQSVYFGSANDVKFLCDRSGNRRFWPIVNVKFDTAALQRDVHQLWAEASEIERSGASIRLPPEMWASAESVQNESMEEEPWTETLGVALDGLEGKIRALEVWLILGIDVAQRNNVEDRRMGHAMRELGWERKQRRYGGNPEWSYIKGEGEERINVERDLATKDVLIIQGEQWWRIAWGTTQRVVYRDEKPKHEEDAA